MATTFEPLSFVEGTPIVIAGLTDDATVAFISVTDEEFIPVTNGEFSIAMAGSVPVSTYNLNVSYFDADKVIIGEPEVVTFSVTAAPVTPTTPTEPTTPTTPTEPTTPTTPTEPTTPTTPTTPTEPVTPTISKEAQALIDKNSSSIQTFVPKYDVKSVESDTDHVQVYPGVGIGFTPLSASAHSASKADEFKIMPDEALALNPAAGYTGGRGTGNPDNFGKYPVRALMTDVRGEFFPKLGDFDPKTQTQYPLGRTADILENSQYPVGFTGKDEKGYSTTSTRGGVDASPITTSGFTF